MEFQRPKSGTKNWKRVYRSEEWSHFFATEDKKTIKNKVNKELAGNENFYSVSERVVGLIIKLNNRFRMKIIHAYALISAYDNEVMERFYEDVEPSMALHKLKILS